MRRAGASDSFCVDNAPHFAIDKNSSTSPLAEVKVNIHLRARARDRNLIDQAAELVGANRSQFMLASALEKAKNVLLDQSAIYTDGQMFQKIMEWMDAPAGPDEMARMKRLSPAKLPWRAV
jgi:uncharacterized protein (DUF1778 family)